MLLRHTALYVLARGAPGLIAFLAIAVYTRLLSPEDYGRYALVVAGVSLFNVVLFQWIRLSLLRFLPAKEKDPDQLLAPILAAFLSVALLAGGIAAALALLWPDPAWRPFLLLGVLLLWAQAWFELNLELYRSRLQPLHYGAFSSLRAVLALGLGASFVLWGLGAYGPLLGLVFAMLLAGMGALSIWLRVPLRAGFSWQRIKPLAFYGLPFAVTFALGFIVSTSDRFLLAWYVGEASAGIYAAGYDLVWQVLGLIAAIINLAAYPLAVRAFEAGGLEAARKRLQQNFTLLLGVVLPATVGLAYIATPFAHLVLGESFHEIALLLPWIAFAQLFFSLKVYHADLAYHLTKQTHYQMGIAALAAVVNIILNIWWIPVLGMAGAVYATFVAYLVGVIASIVLGRKMLKVPLLYRDATKVLMATIVMAMVLVAVRNATRGETGLVVIASSVMIGGAAYLLASLLADVGGIRRRLLQW
jgi:O-antigen/teichoic acid export membrane protein